ncbi:MAG: hypothetical protein E6Q97_28075 [Desulfurellales bacterium]|nr:MAG: hypothetical protein E6Q97_28075 [Desulfurellales bacterium]
MSSRTLPGVIYHTTTMRQAIREADAEVATLTASLRARAFSAPRKPSQITMRGTDTRLNPTTVAPQVVTASWPPPVLAAAALTLFVMLAGLVSIGGSMWARLDTGRSGGYTLPDASATATSAAEWRDGVEVEPAPAPLSEVR